LKWILTIFVFIILISLNQIVFAEPIEKNYGIVNAWFNGEEATVENIQLKIGEPAEIKVEITSKVDESINIKLINPLKTESYKVISGPSKIDEWIDVIDVESGWKKTYIWLIEPTGKWTDGNAPINVFVQFHKEINDDETVKFTIANPYILDEQYPGSTPKPTPDPKSTDQPPSSEGLPGFGLVAALMGVAVVVLTRRSLH